MALVLVLALASAGPGLCKDFHPEIAALIDRLGLQPFLQQCVKVCIVVLGSYVNAIVRERSVGANGNGQSKQLVCLLIVILSLSLDDPV